MGNGTGYVVYLIHESTHVHLIKSTGACYTRSLYTIPGVIKRPTHITHLTGTQSFTQSPPPPKSSVVILMTSFRAVCGGADDVSTDRPAEYVRLLCIGPMYVYISTYCVYSTKK